MRNSKPILLVEDDDLDMMMVESALTNLNVQNQLVMKQDSEEALEYLRNQGHAKPFFILLDWNIPKMNGEEFLTIVKADDRLRKIPVVIFSASDMQEDIDKGFELGAAGYIVKSNDYEQSMDTIGAIIEYWTLCEQPPGGEEFYGKRTI
jgi:CheY-like chemotaxis protein